jgi:pantetheine-phosphate adenylyltransferase
VELLRQSVRGIRGVEVVPFDGLLVNFARRQGVKVLIRGLRAFTDFEYEFQMALSNRKLATDIETVFLMTSETHSYFSSTAVREICELGGDTAGFVPAPVQRALRRRQEARAAAPESA